MKHVDLEKFANGAFSAQVNRAIEEVTENIQNPNTDAGAARKITVTIAFKPNAERNFVATGVQTKQHLHRHSELLLLSVWARTCRPVR